MPKGIFTVQHKFLTNKSLAYFPLSLYLCIRAVGRSKNLVEWGDLKLKKVLLMEYILFLLFPKSWGPAGKGAGAHPVPTALNVLPSCSPRPFSKKHLELQVVGWW